MFVTEVCIKSLKIRNWVSVVAKVMQRILAARLEWFVEFKDLLSKTPCDFGAKISACYQIMHLKI